MTKSAAYPKAYGKKIADLQVHWIVFRLNIDFVVWIRSIQFEYLIDPLLRNSMVGPRLTCS